MDELTLLRQLVVDEPMADEAARAEVWRRLHEGQTLRRRGTTLRNSEEAIDRGQVARPLRRRGGLVAVAAVLLVGGLLISPAFGIGSRLVDLVQGAQPLEVTRPFAWSPDGRKIAFMRERDGSGEIFVINADGSGQRSLMRNRYAADAHAGQTWSPDGRKIAFLVPGGRVSELYVMNADGSGRRKLTRNAGITAPAWSPDGRRVAFRSDRDRNGEIYVMNANGSGLRRLTRNAATDDAPAWSPDGRKIAFVRTPEGNSDGEIYLMNADGTGQRRLTHRGS